MSDEETQINSKAHKQLLNAISNLGKTQHVRKSTRSEPRLHQDEFQLVKSTHTADDDRGPAHPVGVGDLVKLLKTTKRHLHAGKKLRNVQNTKKVLQRPLEKRVAERIKRTIGYDNIKKQLDRWDAVVAHNRSAETQVFPLPSETIYVDTSAHAKPVQPAVKSDLMLEMEATEAKWKALKKARLGDTTDEQEQEERESDLLRLKLKRDELAAMRKEMRFLKMLQSQKAANARRQNKIKSKKYHKLIKREKMKDQIKDFELLQKTDPDAALEKLNEIEKFRVLERASLRHKNTGSWAKNLQIRAKYDKDVRKDLAEQLQISRQLTQKKDAADDGSGNSDNDAIDNTVEMEEGYDPFNPWTRANNSQKDDNVDEDSDLAGWRKYWLERTQNQHLLEEFRKDTEADKVADNETGDDNISNLCSKPEIISEEKSAKRKKSRTKSKHHTVENGWIVEDLKKDENIDDIFDAQEEKIKDRLNKKMEKLTKKVNKINTHKVKKPKLKQKRNELQQLEDLTFKNTKNKPMIDEELNYDETETKENALKGTTIENNNSRNYKVAADIIDPNNIPVIKQKQQIVVLPAIHGSIGEAELEETLDHEQRMTIAEAFEDDDIVADFTRDKEEESKQKNAEIVLSMPGWGTWAGPGTNINNAQMNKRNPLQLDLAEKAKRRDENKNGVYINEEASKHLKAHLVSDVPFPFTSLEDYEASIRAPLGRNFVTETAFRVLTRPSVITRKGQVIDPMDESELIKPPRVLRHIVDRRIAASATSKVKN